MNGYRMWIIVQVADFDCRKVVACKVDETVQEMGGEVVKCGGIGDICVVATFPHRRYRTVQKAISATLNALPVQRTIVTDQDPYTIRQKTAALTMELYRRQDEIVGIS